MSPTLRTLLLWCGGRQSLWTGCCGVPLQGLPLCRGQNLRHQCWSYAISGKCRRYSNAQWKEDAFSLTRFQFFVHLFLTQFPNFSLVFASPSSNFSGSSRWDPVRALRWATISGLHASCCIAWVKTLGLLQHWTPNQWRATGTALVATRMSAPRRWEKKKDCSE